MSRESSFRGPKTACSTSKAAALRIQIQRRRRRHLRTSKAKRKSAAPSTSKAATPSRSRSRERTTWSSKATSTRRPSRANSAPRRPGAATLGLIATNFVRVYHPCTTGFGGGNQPGYMEEPWIYAAILSTSHSFVVDNYKCGSQMNNLNVYGAIAQKFRGPVGQVGSHGYTQGIHLRPAPGHRGAPLLPVPAEDRLESGARDRAHRRLAPAHAAAPA